MIIKKNAGKKAEDIVVENPVEKEPEVKVEEEKIDLFNLDNIDFKQRQERRRGDRRRGFRRIDDRNLISRAREEAQSIKEAAAKEGYQEGLEQAKADILDVKNAITAFLGAKQDDRHFDHIAVAEKNDRVDYCPMSRKSSNHAPQSAKKSSRFVRSPKAGRKEYSLVS